MITKKGLVNDIKALLDVLGVKTNCSMGIIKSLDNVIWVSKTQVLKRKPYNEQFKNVYQLYRVPLYSKDMSMADLLIIKKELESMVKSNNK